MARVIAMASGKGGSGKSMVTANFGIALAKFGKRTLIIDADISMPNLHIFTGQRNIPPVTLYEVLAKLNPPQQAVQKIYGGADLMPCGTSLDGFLKADVRRLKDVVDIMAPSYDYVLLDTSPGLNKYNLTAIRAAGEAIWVVTPDEPSLSSTYRLKTAADVFDVKTVGIIVNKLPSFSWGERKKVPPLRRADIESRFGSKIIGTIPEKKEVYIATLLKKSVIEYSPKGPVTIAFRDMVRSFLVASGQDLAMPR
ncbi:MAG: AAA family ATPase [Candidatus Hadarchaeales archaeon]